MERTADRIRTALNVWILFTVAAIYGAVIDVSVNEMLTKFYQLEEVLSLVKNRDGHLSLCKIEDDHLKIEAIDLTDLNELMECYKTLDQVLIDHQGTIVRAWSIFNEVYGKLGML